MGRPSKYPDELRERAVRMVAENGSVRGLSRTRVQHEESLSCRPGWQRSLSGKPNDFVPADAALQIVHRTEGGRKVDPLLRLVATRAERCRRVIGVHLEAGGPNKHGRATLRAVVAAISDTLERARRPPRPHRRYHPAQLAAP